MSLNKKLCELEKQGFVVTNFKEYKKLVRHGKYVCKDCGLVSRRSQNLCTPKRLYSKGKACY